MHINRYGGMHRGIYALAQVGSRRARPGSDSDPANIQRRIFGIHKNASGLEQEERFNELRKAYEVQVMPINLYTFTISQTLFSNHRLSHTGVPSCPRICGGR